MPVFVPIRTFDLVHELTDDLITQLTDLKSLVVDYDMTRRVNMANLTLLTNLTFLKARMMGTHINDDVLKPLVNLRDLSIAKNSNITDEGLKALTNLEKLNIDRCRRISDEGISRLTKLTYLSAHDTNIGDTGVSNLIQLRTLSAGNTYVTETGVSGLTNLL